MSLRSDYRKSSELHDLVVLFIRIYLELLIVLSVYLSRMVQLFVVSVRESSREAYRLLIKTFFPHSLLRLERRVSAEQDIGSTSCHVGRDRDLIETTCLSDDLSFSLMLLGVQYVMLDTALLKKIRYEL